MSDRGERAGARRAILIAAAAICAAAALWISDGVRVWDGDTHSAWHHYEYLVEGFARGHTYLSLEPDPELLALRDPYDPSANVGHKLWDASLYHGRYYLYFGPAPALMMLPWRLATGHAPPQRIGVGAAAVAEIVALALILAGLRRRHFPALSAGALAAILVVSFHATWLPVLLRRSAVWELPIVSAVACLAWAVYFLWKFHDSGGKAAWALACGAALALLIGCRATYLFSAAVVALLFLAPVAGGAGPPTRARAAAFLACLVAFAGGVGLLAYNHERFGGWLDFGQKYQLWGKEYRGLHFFSAGFIPFNARTYLLSLPQFGPYFPFVHPFSPESAPRGYMETEDIYGILFMMPVHLAGLAACAWAWRSRADRSSRPAVLAVAAAACSSVLSALVLFSFGGACSRYTAELLGGWTIVTAVGLMAVFGAADGPGHGRAARGLAALAGCWTVALVWLACAEYRGYMKLTNPRAYGALAHAFDYPAYWWARGHSVRYGPLDLTLRVPPAATAGPSALMASGRPQMVNYLLLEPAPDGRARLVLAWNEHHVLETPLLAPQAGALRVRVDAPWLYPPPDSPYWDGVPEPARTDRQTLFALAWGSGAVAIHSPHASDPVAFQATLLTPSMAGADSPSVESAVPAEPPP
jgi:hypothetical protein